MERKEAIEVLKERMSINEPMVDESDFGQFVHQEQEALKVAIRAMEKQMAEEEREKTLDELAQPPGETIREQLSERDMTEKEFALRVGMSEGDAVELLDGNVKLTPDIAKRLEVAFDIPACFWSNLERLYRKKSLRKK
ncbi:MAG: hypothetical protein Q4A78_12155 [Peptostreptococcaceae bacterium]|nr:hypothetical protein [Peptostreptococcaceae bacterium]